MYETRVGKFKGALDLRIPTFRHFPEAVKKLPDDLKTKTIVMYCTGGIRCEKASVVMLNSGFRDVRQLEGGILAYLDDFGDSHWERLFCVRSKSCSGCEPGGIKHSDVLQLQGATFSGRANV